MDPAGTRDTYIHTLEIALGLPLKPQYLKDLVLNMDDCVRVFDALQGFYATVPFSQVPEEPSTEFVPVFTADIANLIEPGSLLAKIGQRFDEPGSGPSNRLANLVLYAPRVIISDMIGSYAEMWQQDDVGNGKETRVDSRFVRVNIKPGASDAAIFERGDQRILVD